MYDINVRNRDELTLLFADVAYIDVVTRLLAVGADANDKAIYVLLINRVTGPVEVFNHLIIVCAK